MAPNSQPTAYPLRADYVDALQNPSITLADPMLKRGRVDCDKLGFPRPISGAFASVFQIALEDGSRYAVKCFCQFVSDQERRYSEISSALRMLHHPALVEFEYQQQGVLVAGRWYPVLKMEWVEAQGLLPWLETNRFNGRRLRAVADQLVTIVADLENAGIAHGDLQHGNLLVDSSDRLRLIDYDGMYVPALDGLSANEKGLANYQPPGRDDHHFQPGLDRFSAWVIYVSLISIASAPHLWQMRVDGAEKLLFEAADYINPERSQALIALRNTGSDHLLRLADLIAELARTAVEEMPEFDPAGLLNRPVASGGVSPQHPVTDLSPGMNVGATLAYTAAGGALPSPPLPESASSADGSWLSEYVPTAAPKSFAGSRISVIRTASILVLVLGVGSALGEMLTVSSSIFAIMALILPVVATFTVLWLAYRRHPYYLEVQQMRVDLTAAQRAFHSAEAKHRTFVDQRARVDADLQDRCRRIGEKRTRLSAELQRATAAMQMTLNSALGTITKELATVNASEASKRAAQLQQIQEIHIAQKLSQAYISKNPPTGIGDRLTKRLAQEGIRTAADFSGFYIAGSSSIKGETTWLELPNRYRVHVDGIGPKKAQALADWRASIVAYARQSAPTRLGDLAERQLQAELLTERQHLEQRAAAAKAKAQRDQAAAIDQQSAARYDLDRQEKEANDNAASQRINLDRQLATAQHEVTAKRVALRNAERRRAIYDQITFGYYVKYVAGLKS